MKNTRSKTPESTPLKCYAIIGRVPDGDNITFTCRADSKHVALALFRKELFPSSRQPLNEDCHLEAVFVSQSPITIA